jgi:hypothetical protein
VPGPFTPGFGPVPPALFELHATASLTEEYTDNFRLTSKNKEDNFRTTLAPGFSFLVNTAKTQGSISTSMGLTHDTARGEEDIKFFPSFAAAVRHSFTPRLSLTLTDALTRSDEPALGDTGGLRRERRTFTSNSFSAAVDWLIDRFATQTYYRNSVFFSDTDTVSHIIGANVSSPIGTLNTVRVGYEHSWNTTSGGTNRDSTGDLFLASVSRQVGQFGQAGLSSSYSIQSLNDTRIWNVSLFTAYGLPTGLSLSGSIGYSRLANNSNNDEQGISTNTQVSYRFARAVASLGVFQDFRQTFTEGEDFGVVMTRTYTGSFSYQLTPFISSTLRASYSENDPTGSGNRQNAPSSNTLTAGADLNWQVLRWLGASLAYTYTKRSSGSSPDIVDNRAVLTLRAAF